MQCSVDFHDAIIRFNGRSCGAALMPHATQRDVSLRDSPSLPQRRHKASQNSGVAESKNLRKKPRISSSPR
jgi:hypothetical protein